MYDRGAYDNFFWYPIIIALIYCLSLPLQANQETTPTQTVIRRFAFLVGANDGGSGRTKLHFAVSDAQSIRKVLEEMGGVAPEDVRLLQDPNRETFLKEIKKMDRQVSDAHSAHHKVEVIFYYSGHSDEKNILLGNEKLSYTDFKAAFDRIPADVRIAILDSCASGAFTRLKGGKKNPPFLVDSAFDMKGCAIMTSSSIDEASQESDRLKGAFFTHYLVSGLRGAADMTQDGRITLNEAYQFAFNETRTQTARTLNGPQHPNCNIRMSGTGDVVMTDTRKSSALLEIGPQVSGRLFIHDSKNDLVAELGKSKGRTIELGLEQGKYRVINIVGNKLQETYLQLIPGAAVELNTPRWVPLETHRLDTTVRGDLTALAKPSLPEKLGPLTISAAGGFATQNKTGTDYVWGTGLNLTANLLLTPRIALEFGAGYYHLSRGKSIFHQVAYSTESYNLSAKVRYFFSMVGKMRLFTNAGIGIYDFGLKENSSRQGFNLGTGLEYNLNNHTAFEAALTLNNSWDGAYRLVSLLAGWKYRF